MGDCLLLQRAGQRVGKGAEQGGGTSDGSPAVELAKAQ